MSRPIALVTGGAGFIGSHLCSRLLAEGKDVVCVDNLSTGRLSNIVDLMSSPAFRFIHHDVTEPVDVFANEIYNLACPASPKQYQSDPVKTLRTNVLGAMNILELARVCQARVLQASTSEIYGEPLVHPQPESYWGNVNPIGPRSCYDEGKRCAEAMFTDYQRAFGVDTRIARVFNTYGPRLLPDDGRVVSSFIVQALENQPLTVFGSGQQTRSFCYVDDTVEALIRLMRKAKCHDPVNIGCDEEIRVIDLAQLIVKLTDSRSKIVNSPLPQDDPCRRRPNTSRARAALAWSPQVELVDGLNRTIDHFSELLCSIRRNQLRIAPKSEIYKIEHATAGQ
jgi:UDP-glucuronate decarboxylase